MRSHDERTQFVLLLTRELYNLFKWHVSYPHSIKYHINHQKMLLNMLLNMKLATASIHR